MRLSDLLARFHASARRPPSAGRRVLYAAAAVGLIASAFIARGPGVGVVALAVYGWLLGTAALRPGRVGSWLRAHPRLDLLLIVPLTFLSVAITSDFPLAACAAIGVTVWACVFVFADLYERRGGRTAG